MKIRSFILIFRAIEIKSFCVYHLETQYFKLTPKIFLKMALKNVQKLNNKDFICNEKHANNHQPLRTLTLDSTDYKLVNVCLHMTLCTFLNVTVSHEVCENECVVIKQIKE